MSEPIVTATQAKDFAIGIIRASAKYEAWIPEQMAEILIEAMDFSAQNIEEQVDKTMEAMKEDVDQYGCVFKMRIDDSVTPEMYQAYRDTLTSPPKMEWKTIASGAGEETWAMQIGHGVLVRQDVWDDDGCLAGTALTFIDGAKLIVPVTCGERATIEGSYPAHLKGK